MRIKQTKGCDRERVQRDPPLIGLGRFFAFGLVSSTE